MRLLSVAIAVLGACSSSCGGGSSGPTLPAQDYSGNFTGHWSGTVSGAAGGQAIPPSQATTDITRQESNHLSIGGICPDGSPVPALVTGPAALSVSASSCPPFAATTCSAVTVTFSGGSGILANGTLSLVFDGTMAGCGKTFSIELLFTGTLSIPPPTITSLSPSAAVAGDPGFTLTITGTGFASGATVAWNGSPRPTTFVSSTELRADIAAADIAQAGYVSVTVSNPGGATAGVSFQVSNPAPAVASLSPDTVLTGSSGVTLTLTGSGFAPGSVASWNGSPRPTTYVSGTTLQVALAAQDLVAAGSGTVTVQNPAPGGGTSGALTLHIVNPVPTATAMSPTSAAPGDPRFTLTVTGSGFVGTTVVQWNGATRATTVISPGVLHAAIDAADVATAGSAAVSVTTPTPGGGTASAGSFAIAAAPASPPQSVAYQIDPAHSGRALFGVPLVFHGSPAWSVTLGGAASYPLIAGGKVFVLTRGSSTGGYGTQLYALDLASGAIAWGPTAIGGTYYWSGLAFENGRIFVLNYDGQLSVFDSATGTAGWSVKLPYQYAFSAAPTAAHGVVYVGGSGIGGTMYAVDESNGALLWSSSVWNGDQSSPAVGLDGVFVSYPCQVYKLDLITGSQIWRHNGPCEGGGGKTAAYAHGSLYVRDPMLNTPIGTIYDAYDGVTTGLFGPSSGWMPIPAFGASYGFFLSGGVLEARDLATLALVWSFSGDGQLTSAPIVIDDVVVVGSASGTVYALDVATGTQRWSGAAGAPIPSPDEQNVSQPLTGLGAGEGYLVVPAGSRLTAWRLVAP